MQSNYLLKCFVCGYYNQYLEFKNFVFKNSESDYRTLKFKLALNYLGIGLPINCPSVLFGPVSFLELLISICIVICKFFISFVVNAKYKRKTITDKILTPGLEISTGRFKRLYNVIDDEIVTIKIPYRSNEYNTPQISLYKGIGLSEVFLAFKLSLMTILCMYRKFRKRDFLFRNYSSFEYYLTCLFVLRNPQNKYVFHNQVDKWAMFFSNVRNNTFVQHGKIEENAKFIKIMAPKKAYYLNEGQKKVLETVLFKSLPQEYEFRPHLSFAHNEKLLNNQKKNVLIVSGLDFLEEEVPIIAMIKEKNLNIYLKPHPKDKVMSRYNELREKYGIILLDKDDFPKVDIVISYNSTLAYEYEDVGVEVIRYDLLKEVSSIKDMV